MFANLSLKVKLIGGFALVAAITAVVGGVGYWGVQKLGRSVEEIGLSAFPRGAPADDQGGGAAD